MPNTAKSDYAVTGLKINSDKRFLKFVERKKLVCQKPQGACASDQFSSWKQIQISKSPDVSKKHWDIWMTHL